jgi:hypothetical protein
MSPDMLDRVQPAQTDDGNGLGDVFAFPVPDPHGVAGDLDCRFSAILTLLSYKYQTIGHLMKSLERHKAFEMPNGKPLRQNSLRVAILRCLKKDVLARQIDIVSEVEKHGKTRLLIRRRQNV